MVRQPKAYPVYDGCYADNVEVLRAELRARFPNLHVAGRNGMHKYNNQDHSMMTAMLTVENILAGREVYDQPQLVRGWDEYLAGRPGDGLIFWRVLVTELWMRRYLDEKVLVS